MKHPSEAMLALFAGRDLGFFARWRTGRHLAGCERCRGEIETFGGMRDRITALDELQGISWNRLAAEMKANIRVGLEAGECVALEPSRAPLFGGARALAAYASVALLLLAGLWLQRVTPPAHTAQRAEGAYGHATANGVEVREGDQAFGLSHGSADNVTYSVGAQGAMRARYVDPKSGYVTINTVYVQ